jgi:hypothetical protein
LVLFTLEVVFVLAKSVPWIHHDIVRERDRCWVTDTEINASNTVTR